MKEAQKIVNATAKAVGAKKVEVDDDVAKVSIIGRRNGESFRCCG